MKNLLSTRTPISPFVNLLIVVLLTRILDKPTFGEYRYTVVFYALVAVLTQLGIPYSASVLLTRIDDELRSRRLITLTSLTMSLLGLTVSALVALGLGGARLGGLDLNRVLLASSPFLVVGVLQAAWIEMLKGANRIADIAIQTLGPYLLILGGATALWLTVGRGFPYWMMLAVHVAAYGILQVATLARFWAWPGEQLRELGGELRASEMAVGRHVYLGAVVAVATTNFVALVVGQVVGMETYASYALALSMALPVQMIPAVMGMVLFRENARSPRLGRRSIQVTLGMTLLFLAVFLLCLALLFPLVFPPEYVEALKYTWWLCPAYAVIGLGDYLNRFVGAKGHGRWLMWGAAASGVTNLVVTLTLLHAWGVWAAVAGSLSGACVYAGSMLWAYRRAVVLAELA